MNLSAIAVIPARNEAEYLPGTLQALKTVPGLTRLLVVDDGSRDETVRLARFYGAEVLPGAPPGRSGGKGAALLAGLSRARHYRPDIVLLADADLGPAAALLGGLLEVIEERRTVAIAAFPPAVGGGFGAVKGYARRAIARSTGYVPSEPLSGQRALRTIALDVLPGIAPGFGAEVGMTLDLLAAGIEPLEVPLPLKHRPTGRTLAGFAHRARQGVDVLRAIHGARLPW